MRPPSEPERIRQCWTRPLRLKYMQEMGFQIHTVTKNIEHKLYNPKEKPFKNVDVHHLSSRPWGAFPIHWLDFEKVWNSE